MKNKIRSFFVIFTIIAIAVISVGCSREADVASENLSYEADQFRIDRRIVFYNGITDKYILQVEGRCSLGNSDTNLRMSVTCKVGENRYVKHFLGLSDNVTFFAEQLEASPVDVYRYKVVFRPTEIIPNVEVDLP